MLSSSFDRRAFLLQDLPDEKAIYEELYDLMEIFDEIDSQIYKKYELDLVLQEYEIKKITPPKNLLIESEGFLYNISNLYKVLSKKFPHIVFAL